MKRTTVLLVVMLATGTLAAGRAPAAVPPQVRSLTRQAEELEIALRMEQDAARRKNLMDELEAVQHQIGPYDAAGKRVHPRAMWHDAAIEAMAAEIKRLERLAAQPPSGPAWQGRSHARRMAVAGLMHGWAMPEGALKYQVNSFGQYLANNMLTLDRLFDRLAAWMVTESKLEDGSPHRPIYKTHFDKAKEGLAKMELGAQGLERRDLETEDAAVAAMAQFVEGLRAVRDAVEALREWAARQGTAEPVPEPAPGEAAPPPESAAEPPEMTDQEKARLAAVRAIAGRLDGSPWQQVRQYLERYAQAVENGFAVPSARPRAREFLEQIERAAALAEGLAGSKAVYREYLTSHARRLADALEMMESPLQRARGYARLSGIWSDDQFRRQLELGGLTPEGGHGILYAYHVVWPEARQTQDPAALEQAQALRNACLKIAEICERKTEGPPKDMVGRLGECYKRQEQVFVRAASEAGAFFPNDRATGVQRTLDAGERGRDLERLIRADRVVKAVQTYMPARAKPMYDQLGPAAQELVAGNTGTNPRGRLERLIRPFEGLERFPLPEAHQTRAATQIAGRAFAAAKAVLSRDVANGIEAASRGDPRALNQALEARWLFNLLTRRAAADTAGLPRAGAANLTAFSLPEKTWETFVSNLDKYVRAVLTKYAADGRQNWEWMHAPNEWDAVYHPVACAQRRTLDARTEGETDLDFLLRHLEQVAVASPHWTRWQEWATGYHVAEAATTMNAGAAKAAQWHRERVRNYSYRLRETPLEPPAAKKGP